MIIREYMVPMRDGVRLYTCAVLPEGEGTFPIVLSRSPYEAADAPPEAMAGEYTPFVEAGYAWVRQQCRGTARSEGVMEPFVYERRDGLDTLDWLRQQPFYQGEIYPVGGSYLSFVHMSYLDTCPEDVKGAMLSVMPPDMYDGLTVNGFPKMDISVPWTASMYHKKQADVSSFWQSYPAVTLKRPLCRVLTPFFDDGCPAFEAQMHSEGPDAPWRVPNGPGDALNALKSLRVPILMIEGWYDIYIGSAEAMWRDLDDDVKARSAFVIGPWPHSCRVSADWDIAIENGDMPASLPVSWLDHLRTGAPLQGAAEGRVTYYTLGQSGWRLSADVPRGAKEKAYYLCGGGMLKPEPEGPGARTWRHDPDHPVGFPGGANAFVTVPSGVLAQPEPDFSEGVISFVSEPLEADMVVTGRIDIDLTVRTAAEDSAVFVRVDVVRDDVALPMQESITAISHCAPDAKPGEDARVTMRTDPLSWRLRAGDRLRVDVASANWPTYPSHGNVKGFVTTQTRAVPAVNTLVTGVSRLILPIE